MSQASNVNRRAETAVPPKRIPLAAQCLFTKFFWPKIDRLCGQMRRNCKKYCRANVQQSSRVGPKLATLLVWLFLFLVVIHARHVLFVQRQALRCGLKLIVDVIGASVLHPVGENKPVGFLEGYWRTKLFYHACRKPQPLQTIDLRMSHYWPRCALLFRILCFLICH